MPQLHAILITVSAALLLALKAGIVIGSIGTLLEGLGDLLQAKFAPKSKMNGIGQTLSGFGKTLEAWGTDVPKLVQSAQQLLAKVANVFGIGLVTIALCLMCGGCAFLQSKAPAALACLPTPAALAAQVAQILLAGGDYVAALKSLELQDTTSAVVCAVHAFLAQHGPAASSSLAAAHARGKVYLASKGVQ